MVTSYIKRKEPWKPFSLSKYIMTTDYLMLVWWRILFLTINYLTAIFIAFSSLQFKVALIIFQIFLANEIPVYYPLECFFSLYHIQVTTNLHRNRKIKVMKSAVCPTPVFAACNQASWTENFSLFCRVVLKIFVLSPTRNKGTPSLNAPLLLQLYVVNIYSLYRESKLKILKQ